MKKRIYLFLLILLLPIKVLALNIMDYYSINIDSANLDKEIKVREEFAFQKIDYISRTFEKRIDEHSTINTNFRFEKNNDKITFTPTIYQHYYIEYSINTADIGNKYSNVGLVAVDYEFYPIDNISKYNNFYFNWRHNKTINTEYYHFLEYFEFAKDSDNIEATLLEGETPPNIKIVFSLDDHEKKVNNMMLWLNILFHTISVIILIMNILIYWKKINISNIICIIVIIIYSIVSLIHCYYLRANIIPLFDKSKESYLSYCVIVSLFLIVSLIGYISNKKILNKSNDKTS